MGRSPKKKKRSNRGFTIVVIMVLVGVILSFTLALVGYVFSSKQVKFYVQEEFNAINLAETGISKAIFCLNSDYDAGCEGTYGDNYIGETRAVVGHGEYETVVTGTLTEKVIESTGTLLNGSSRTVSVTVTNGPPVDPALSPDYGVQAGPTGMRIEDRATINGPVYSGGYIRCDSLYNDIVGDVYSSEVNGLIYRCDITGDAHADRIWRSDITGDAYYDEAGFGISNTTISGTKYAGSTTPETLPLPEPNIEFWETSAEYGGLIEGDYVASTEDLGPIHITGSLTIPTGATVTMTGPIWVDDYVEVQDGGVLELDPDFSQYGSVLLIGDYDDPHPENQIIVNCTSLTETDDLNIVGDVGLIMKHDETSGWYSESSPTAETLWDLHLRSSVDGWAVGNGGMIVQWNGTSWITESSPTTVLLGSVSAATATDAWAVGSGGTIIRWDGTSWASETSPTSNALYGVDAYSSTNVWAVGDSGTIIHRDNGSAWAAVSSPTSALLRDVKLISSDDGWAVGDGGVIVHWDGTSWSTVTSPTAENLYAVHGIDGSEVWAVGDNSTILFWNGSNWTSKTSPTSADFKGVQVTSDTETHIVGTAGTIVIWDGSSLSAETSPETNDLQAVSGLIGSCANPPNLYGSGHEDSYLMVIANGSGTGVDTAAVYLHTGVTGGIFLATHGRVSHIGDSSVTHVSGDYVFMKSEATVDYDVGLATAEFSNSPPGVWRIKSGTWYEK